MGDSSTAAPAHAAESDSLLAEVSADRLALDGVFTRVTVGATAHERLVLLRDLLAWLVDGSTGQVGEAARLPMLTARLLAAPALRDEVSFAVAALLSAADSTPLFSNIGIPSQQGFFSEAADRLWGGMLPQPEAHLGEVMLVLFPDEASLSWLERAEPRALRALVESLFPPRTADGESPFQPLLESLADALLLLSRRASAVGTGDDVRARAPEFGLRGSPFVQLTRATDAFLGKPGARDGAEAAALKQRIAECREVLATVQRHLEEFGVSVDLVFRIDLLGRQLQRLEELAALLVPGNADERTVRAAKLLAQLLRAAREERSVSGLVMNNVELLARKVVERAGETGEGYVTRTKEEFHRMVDQGAGGGLVTAFAVASKILLALLPLPLFFQGFANGLNYAAAFVLMQLCHFTLASKQPSVTAAALAGALTDKAEHASEMVARLNRSALAALFGNLGGVIPVTALLGVLALALGTPLIDDAKAKAILENHHPFGSATLLYAAFTGFLLWVASLVGGWTENFIVYRRLPEGLARHSRLLSRLGEARARGLASFVGKSGGGLVSAAFFGMSLGLAPVWAEFFGLPLEVRHVTFVGGQVALAAVTLGSTAASTAAFWWAASSIALVGAVNLTVSFALSFALAVRARRVTARQQWRFLRSLLSRARREPLRFFWPPRA